VASLFFPAYKLVLVLSNAVLVFAIKSKVRATFFGLSLNLNLNLNLSLGTTKSWETELLLVL